MSTLLLLLLIPLLGTALVLAFRHSDAIINKLAAEVKVAHEQAAHIKQTAAVEFSTLESTIKAYERQGANKLRTELSQLGGDIVKIEEKLGFPITPKTQPN